ncbi:hypothetical protein C5167_030189 [Papaver somniferum]|nr:hypothetical protein C5167_030189 [Papaver somniferum]
MKIATQNAAIYSSFANLGNCSVAQCLASVSWSSWSNGANCSVGLLRRSFFIEQEAACPDPIWNLKPPTEISFSLSGKVCFIVLV